MLNVSGKEFYAADVRKTSWGSKNCYWDEKSIDIQWNSNERPPSGGNLELGFSRNIEVCNFVRVSEVAFTMSRQPTRMADSKKVSGELFSLTYGALVAQIVKVDSLHQDWSIVHAYLFPRITRMSTT